MRWRQIDQGARDVALASGEILRTVASFQGSENDHDIIKAHVALDAGDSTLVTEFEDAAGKRQLGRTTRWPASIAACMVVVVWEVKARLALIDPAPTTSLQDLKKEIEADAPTAQPPVPTTETTPESEATGGSGDPAAPGGHVVLEIKDESLAADSAVAHKESARA